MDALLICPSRRDGIKWLAERSPCALLPFLGQTLLEYWLVYLAGKEIKTINVIADDRPDQIRAFCGSGTRWGLEVQVESESRELTPAEALLKYQRQLGLPVENIWAMDHFPGCDLPLFESYEMVFTALEHWVRFARTPERVGVHELRSNVFVELQARISPEAELRPPCWIGRNAWIGPRTIIGPDAFLEAGVFVEADTEIVRSYVGPDTYVGRFAQISDSFSWASALIDWKNGSAATVADPFLLCGLRAEETGTTDTWFDRLADLLSFATKQGAALACRQPLTRKEGRL
jgi:NDP-sugar pyrophosphorylase family protein